MKFVVFITLFVGELKRMINLNNFGHPTNIVKVTFYITPKSSC